MNTIIHKEDIVRESEPILYFDVDGLMKACEKLHANKCDSMTIKHCDSMIVNMRNVSLTIPWTDNDEQPTIISMHAYNPPVTVPIEIADAEKYVFIINGSELKLKDYVIRRNAYTLKFYDEKHPDGILNIGDIVRLTIKDDYRCIENAYGIISNIGSIIRITFADPDLVNRHKMKRASGDVTVSITLSGESLMYPNLKEFEIERINR